MDIRYLNTWKYNLKEWLNEIRELTKSWNRGQWYLDY